MAINWNWKKRIGKVVMRQENENGIKYFTFNMYEGNCLAILVNEWKDEDIDKFNLYTFIADEQHARNMYKEYGNIFCESKNQKITDIRLNTYYSGWQKRASLFVKCGYEVTLYHEVPVEKPIPSTIFFD